MPEGTPGAALARLQKMLRPAGGGVYVVSTGVAEQQALMQAVPEPDPVREKGRAGQALQGELPSVANPPPGCVFAGR